MNKDEVRERVTELSRILDVTLLTHKQIDGAHIEGLPCLVEDFGWALDQLLESLDRESKLKKALKFYASRRGYRHGTISLGPPVHLDEGKIARLALDLNPSEGAT